MGVAATLVPKGLGPQDPTKKLAHWVDLLGQPLTRNLFSKISGLNPPLIVHYNSIWTSSFKKSLKNDSNIVVFFCFVFLLFNVGP